MVSRQHISHARRPPVRFRGRKAPISGLPTCSRLPPVPEELRKLSRHRNGRPGLLGLRLQFSRGLRVDPRLPTQRALLGMRVDFFTCNFTCKVWVLAVLVRS